MALTLNEEQVREMAERLRHESDLTFAEKENRDAVAKAAQALGFEVKRSSIAGQQLHPMYIADRPSGNTGFGNTAYQSYWSRLYEVSRKDRGW